MPIETIILLALFVVVTIIGAAGWFLGSAILASVQKSRRPRLPAENLPTDYLTEHHRLLRPLRQVRHQIEKVLTDHPDSMQVRTLGKDVLDEADDVIRQCGSLAAQIDSLRTIALQKPTAQKALETLKSRALTARSEQESTSYVAAISARESEVDHYDTATRHADALEAVVLQANAALAELAARLYTSIRSTSTFDTDTESLRAGLGRLRTLRESVSESEELHALLEMENQS